MTEMTDGPRPDIVSRLILFFPGFEPLGAGQHRGRFEHALKKTGPVYQADFSATGLETRPSGMPGFRVSGSGNGWQTETDVVIFDWSPVLDHFAARTMLVRFGSGLIALLGFIIRGTLFRYLKTSWRYGLFFAYPLVLILGCLILGWLAAGLIGSGLIGTLAGSAVCALALGLASQKAHLLLMMDDWAFASHLAAGGHTVIEDTSKTFRRALEAELNTNTDEILVIGHSLGCVFAVDALAGANTGKNPKPALMTTGSSLLKIALDKRASWLRQRVGTLVASGFQWLDVQSLTDPISFFGSNPAVSCGFANAPRLKTMRIRFRMMLSAQSYAKGKFNLFRTHRQFVLGVERPYFYSMHMFACGPIPFARIWADGGLPQEMKTISRP